MTSLLEQIKNGGITIDLPDGYSVEVTEDRVVVYGCDCASVATDAQVEKIYEALGAYRRIVRNRKEKK